MKSEDLYFLVNKQSKWWKYAAATLPFSALAILVFEYFLGWSELYAKTLIIISTAFFTVSVIWWWWAIDKLLHIIQTAKKTESNLNKVKDEIHSLRKQINNK